MLAVAAQGAFAASLLDAAGAPLGRGECNAGGETPDLRDVLVDGRWRFPSPPAGGGPASISLHWEALGPLQTGCKKAGKKNTHTHTHPHTYSQDQTNFGIRVISIVIFLVRFATMLQTNSNLPVGPKGTACVAATRGCC